MKPNKKDIEKQLSELTMAHINMIKNNFEILGGIYRTPVFKYCTMKLENQNSIDELLKYDSIISYDKQWGLVGSKKLYQHIKNLTS
jgi:hypothetical protein